MREKSKQFHDGQVSHLGVIVVCRSRSRTQVFSEIAQVALSVLAYLVYIQSVLYHISLSANFHAKIRS